MAAKVTAFDIATSCGCADGAPGTTPRCWTWKFNGADRYQRYGQALEYFQEYFSENKVDALFFELPLRLAAKGGRGDNEAAVDVLRGLIGIATGSASRAGVKHIQGVDVQAGRRALLVHSPAAGEGKQAVWDQCKMLGWPVTNEDESDACSIWNYGCAMMNPRTAHLSTELFARR